MALIKHLNANVVKQLLLEIYIYIFNKFKSLGLSITIKANTRATEFLDVWMDLTTRKHRPYMKANSTPSLHP